MRVRFVSLVVATVVPAWLGLAALSSAAAADCTRKSGAPTSLDIENQSGADVSLYWINTQCEAVRYGTLAPGRAARQPTYVGHVWQVRHAVHGWVLRHVTATSKPARLKIGSLAAPLERAERDRADDVTGHQVHVIYALPSDGADRGLDRQGVIARAVGTSDQWFVRQTGGPRLRWDTREGSLDVSFVRLDRSSTDLASAGLYSRDRIEEELRGRRLIAPRKIYLVFLDGGHGVAKCGGAAFPPVLNGQVTVLYLQGTPPGAPPCSSNPFAASPDSPGYWEFSIVHEVLHTLGFVARCAPNNAAQGHVSDTPTDLMYAGSQPWQPSVLDSGRNDYFGHRMQDCLDLSRSVFLDPLPADATVPPGWAR